MIVDWFGLTYTSRDQLFTNSKDYNSERRVSGCHPADALDQNHRSCFLASLSLSISQNADTL